MKKSFNNSKIRTWALIQKEKKDPQKELIEILSDSIIYGLSSFCHLDTTNEEIKNQAEVNHFNELCKKVQPAYATDSSAFEMGCYLYFRINLWNFQKKKGYRDTVLDYLISRFLYIFSVVLNSKVEELKKVLDNRMDLYEKIVMDIKNNEKIQEEIYFYLTQLLARTENNKLPEVYNFNKKFLIIILDAFEDFFLKKEILSFDKIMVPIILENFGKFCLFHELSNKQNK